MITLSVVTPLYNGRAFIAETALSILGQVSAVDEYLVIDDGSTDGGGEIVAGLSDRVRVVRQENGGEAQAVNRGVAMTSAPVIGVVNADDPILPGLLEAVRAAFGADPDLAAVYPDWRRIDVDGATLSLHRTREFSLRALYAEHVCVPGPGAFFRRACLGDEPVRDPAMHGLTDYDFWLRFALRNRNIRRIPQVLACWRAHRAGATYRLDGAALARRRVQMIERLFARPDLPDDIARLRRQALSAAHYNAALQGLRDPKAPALRHALASYAALPLWPSGAPEGQRRSWAHLAYAAAQPLSAWAHQALNPVLPSRFRRQAVLDLRFGLSGAPRTGHGP